MKSIKQKNKRMIRKNFPNKKTAKLVKEEKPISSAAIEFGKNLKERFQDNVFEKIAKSCLYLLIFLLPLFFLPLTIAPLEINKQFLATVLVLVASFCYLINSLKSQKIVYPRSLLSLAVLILLIIAGLSAIFSQARGMSIFGNFIEVDTFWNFFIYGLVFFLTASIFKKEDFTKIGFCFFAGLILVTILGLPQIFGKFIFPWAFSQQPGFNPFGSVFSWGIFITFGLVMIITVLISLKLSKLWKIILALTGSLIFLIIISLNYHLLWLGLVLAMFLLAAYKFSLHAKINLLLITIIIVSFFFILASQQIPTFAKAPVEIRPDFTITLTIAKGVFTELKQVFLGTGPATFNYDFSRFRPVELNQNAFWPIGFSQGFSFLTTILSTLGLLGILTTLFLIFSFILKGLKTLKDEKYLIISSGVSFLIINLFFYPASFVQLLFIFFGFGLMAIDARKDLKTEFYSSDKLRNIRFIVFVGIILLLSLNLFLFYLTSQKYAAAVYYEKGLRSSSLAQSVTNIEKAVRLDSQSDQYLRFLSQARLLQANELIRISSAQEKPQDIQIQLQNIIAWAINAARRATELNPIDPLNWSNLGNVYENIILITTGADVFAKESYQKAMELDPQNPQLPVDLARVFITSADQSRVKNEINLWEEKIGEAKKALEKSISLKSDYAPAHFLMAQIYIRENNLAKAIEKLEELKLSNLGDAGLAFQLGFLYYRNNQTDQAQKEFERTVTLDENYSNARYFLGLIYEQKGEKQKAIEQFEKIEKLNPDNQEVKKILINLREGRAALEGIVPPAQPPAERIEAPVPETKEPEKPTTP